MQIKLIKENEVSKLKDLKEKFIIFGAGDLGTKVIAPMLKQNGINVSYFWDNDLNKQGKLVDRIKILSYNELAKQGRVSIIVGSNYIKQEEARIDKLNCSDVIQIAIPEPLLNESDENINNYIKEIKQIKNFFKDDLSLKSIDCFLDYLKNRDVSVFKPVAVTNEHYLVNEVVKSLKPDDVFVDLGAFIGEFPAALVNNNIPYKKCYCFEISSKNCFLLREYTEKAGINNIEILQMAVYNEDRTIKINECNANSAITDDLSGKNVKAVKLDTFFDRTPFNYIKTDIEGAEMPALQGGINVIKKYRPILAISIYHSIGDYLNIPTFLHDELENYTFLIRNHSLFCAEIVLYAIPNERISEV